MRLPQVVRDLLAAEAEILTRAKDGRCPCLGCSIPSDKAFNLAVLLQDTLSLPRHETVVVAASLALSEACR